jgi:hypothetical protein
MKFKPEDGVGKNFKNNKFGILCIPLSKQSKCLKK